MNSGPLAIWEKDNYWHEVVTMSECHACLVMSRHVQSRSFDSHYQYQTFTPHLEQIKLVKQFYKSFISVPVSSMQCCTVLFLQKSCFCTFGNNLIAIHQPWQKYSHYICMIFYTSPASISSVTVESVLRNRTNWKHYNCYNLQHFVLILHIRMSELPDVGGIE